MSMFYIRGTFYNDISILCRCLSDSLAEGVSEKEAINMICENSKNQQIRNLAMLTKKNMDSGMGLQNAIYKESKFPKVLRYSMLNAIHERNRISTLDEMESLYLSLSEVEIARRRNILYPAIVMITVFSVIIALMTFVIPSIIGMFDGVNIVLPAITIRMLSACEWLNEYILAIVISLAIIFLILFACSKTYQGARMSSLFKMNLPIIRGIYNKYVTARTVMVLNSLLNLDINLKQALFILEESFSDYEIVREDMFEICEKVDKGCSFKDSLKDSEYFKEIADQIEAIDNQDMEEKDLLRSLSIFNETTYLKNAGESMLRLQAVSVIVMMVFIVLLFASLLKPLLQFYELIQKL